MLIVPYSKYYSPVSLFTKWKESGNYRSNNELLRTWMSRYIVHCVLRMCWCWPEKPEEKMESFPLMVLIEDEDDDEDDYDDSVQMG